MTLRPCVSTDPTLEMKNKSHLLFWVHNKAQEKVKVWAEVQGQGRSPHGWRHMQKGLPLQINLSSQQHSTPQWSPKTRTLESYSHRGIEPEEPQGLHKTQASPFINVWTQAQWGSMTCPSLREEVVAEGGVEARVPNLAPAFSFIPQTQPFTSSSPSPWPSPCGPLLLFWSRSRTSRSFTCITATMFGPRLSSPSEITSYTAPAAIPCSAGVGCIVLPLLFSLCWHIPHRSYSLALVLEWRREQSRAKAFPQWSYSKWEEETSVVLQPVRFQGHVHSPCT